MAPLDDDSGRWAVTDHGELCHCAPLDCFRVSVLWKADVYRSDEERRDRIANRLSMSDVADRFNHDLASRPTGLRFDPNHLDDPGMRAALAGVYPEARPIEALASVFESYA